jgi:arsenite methyltransferase
MKILFLCTGNSCRSQMAEGYARSIAGKDFEIRSAGLEARGVNPRAIQMMQEIGIDISKQQSTTLTSDMLSWADVVITLCGHADEHCPALPKHIQKLHWPLSDPAKATGTEEQVLSEFRQVRDEIRRRIDAAFQGLKKTEEKETLKSTPKSEHRDESSTTEKDSKKGDSLEKKGEPEQQDAETPCCSTTCCSTSDKPESKYDLPQEEKIRENIRQSYSEIAKTSLLKKGGSIFSSCSTTCAPSDGMSYSKKLGYSEEEASTVPDDSNLGLGCGNPQAIAELKAGEAVLDLGSGGGFDCFLAAKKVGSTGRVIGVDMTSEMIAKARANAQKGNYKNVEFRLGEIEALPVADNNVDVIISNCVVNLSTNKEKVFKEAARVLKPGGRLAIMDVVATQEIPPSIKSNLSLYSGCVAGATPIDELKKTLRESGFENVTIAVKEESRSFIKGWSTESGAENYVASASITASKPTLAPQQTTTTSTGWHDTTSWLGTTPTFF